MAGGASSGKPHEISNRGVLVAGVALHHGMSAQKREAIKVILNRLIGNLPTENRVALRAIGSHLRAVNVCMAVGAIFTNFRKYRLGVATCAGNFYVHSAQRIFRGVVIEFRNCANRGPA
jgi:hypothetical protein